MTEPNPVIPYRPKRRPKPPPTPTEIDHAVKAQASSEEIENRAIIDGLNALEAELDRRWGIGRLRLLASDSLRARFDSQRQKFDAAVVSRSYTGIRTHGPAMRRAWEALEAAAVAAGHTPMPPDVWELVLPSTGEVVAILRDPADIVRASTGRYILASEIAKLVDGSATWSVLLQIREQMPGARIVAVGKRGGDANPSMQSEAVPEAVPEVVPEVVPEMIPEIDWDVGDAIPFGQEP